VAEDSSSAAVARLQRERDLFLALLNLGQADDVLRYANAALELLVSVTGAARGYFELYGAQGEPPLATAMHGLSSVEAQDVRARLSTGIIRDALSTGRTVSTASALEDPRFAGFASVQVQKLRAVLCAPLSLGVGAGIGVLYLEGRSGPGPFPEDDRALIELAARALAPNVERLLCLRDDAKAIDHTAELRTRLGPLGIIGKSRALADVLRQVLAAAHVPVAVLFRGESGTGKSALARALHDASPRKKGPFVELNVATLPDTLFESELFGAEKGAHSQASSRAAGKVDAASGGTLFLDEIGELSLVSQTKLLGFLQSKAFMRLGGTTQVVADVRIVAATNADLEELVAEKRFRQDLYYRLNVLEIVVPPLRERRTDVGDIAEALAARLGDDAEQRLPLSRAALRALEESDWPGNVRQLENVIARGWAGALSENASVIEPRHLFGDRGAEGGAPEASAATFQDATRQFQGKLIEDTLLACDWNVSEAARRLALSRSHLNELIRGLGLARRRPG